MPLNPGEFAATTLAVDLFTRIDEKWGLRS
jgi:hypothetical protein